MKWPVVAACVLLVGCAASREEVVSRLGSKYIGASTDALVRDLGPPATTFRMNSGETSLVWQLTSITDISGSDGRGQASTRFCKVMVIADQHGTVRRLDTEDSNAGRGGIATMAGAFGSICAQRLGMEKAT